MNKWGFGNFKGIGIGLYGFVFVRKIFCGERGLFVYVMFFKLRES